MRYRAIMTDEQHSATLIHLRIVIVLLAFIAGILTAFA
jgi:hypothetical protein